MRAVSTASGWRSLLLSEVVSIKISCTSTERHLYSPWTQTSGSSGFALATQPWGLWPYPLSRLVYSCLLRALSLWLHRAPFSILSNWAPSAAHGSCTHPSLCPSFLLLPVLGTLSVKPQAGSEPHSHQPCCVNRGTHTAPFLMSSAALYRVVCLSIGSHFRVINSLWQKPLLFLCTSVFPEGCHSL